MADEAAPTVASNVADAPAAPQHERARLIRRIRHGDSYVLLFGLIVIVYFLLSLVQSPGWWGLPVLVLAAVTLIAAMRTSRAPRRMMRAAQIVAAVGLAVPFVSVAIGASLLWLEPLVFLLLLAAAPFVIMRRLLQHREVTIETLAGAIDVYLLIGLLFAVLYQFIGRMSALPFFVQTDAPASNQYLYFSFVTLATVGYGDLTPATALGRSLVVVEAVTGQVFLVTAVAAVVSQLIGERR